MKILAVDTSSSVAAVAIMDERELLGEFILNHKMTHSQKLIPMIDMIFKNLGICPEEIDIYAASSGPGSFTGLRIGITTIKAMAFAAKKPVVSIPTLDALAYNVPYTESLVCPMMDARNNQVYTALYKNEKGIQMNISEYMGVPVQELVQIIRGKNNDVIFVGDGVLIHNEYLKSELGIRCGFAPQSLLLQRASSVAQLALYRAVKGKVESCFDMMPFYLRKSQAERELEKKRQEKTPEAE